MSRSRHRSAFYPVRALIDRGLGFVVLAAVSLLIGACATSPIGGDGLGGSGVVAEGDGLGGTGLIGPIASVTDGIEVNGLRVSIDDETAVSINGSPGSQNKLRVGHVVTVLSLIHI